MITNQKRLVLIPQIAHVNKKDPCATHKQIEPTKVIKNQLILLKFLIEHPCRTLCSSQRYYL